MTQAKPNEEEVIYTSMPTPVWRGWYCTNHPAGEQLANLPERAECWGCGHPRPESKEEPS